MSKRSRYGRNTSSALLGIAFLSMAVAAAFLILASKSFNGDTESIIGGSKNQVNASVDRARQVFYEVINSDPARSTYSFRFVTRAYGVTHLHGIGRVSI